LDENQVTDLLGKLLNEKEELNKRQGHLSSLMKLAEKTISEADIMAEQIKTEAESRAKEEAKQLRDSIVAEATANANKQAETLKQKALEEAHETLEKRAEELQAKLNQSVQDICQRMLGQTETLTRDLTALKIDLEREASTLPKYASLNTTEATDEEVPQTNEMASPTVIDETPATEVVPLTNEVPTVEVAATPANMEKFSEVEKAADTSSVEFSSVNEMKFLEIEVLPPRDTNEINKIRTFLNKLPGVQAEPPRNFVDKTTIKVLFSREINLTKALSDQTFVQQVYDVEENGIRKIQVSLNLQSALDESKEALSRNVRQVLRR